MQTYILTVKNDFGTGRFFVTANDEPTAHLMLMKMENCPAGAIKKTEVLTMKKSFYYSFTRYYKAAKTKDFVFYVNYQEDDEVIMFNKDMNLISNNYFASQGLYDAIEANEILWSSRTMKPNIKELKRQIELNKD